MIHKTVKTLVIGAIGGGVLFLFVLAFLILFTPHTLIYHEKDITVIQTNDTITINYIGEGAVDFSASTHLSTGVMNVSAHYTLWDKLTGTGGSFETTNQETTMIQFSDKNGVYTLWQANNSDLEKYNSVDHTDGRG